VAEQGGLGARETGYPDRLVDRPGAALGRDLVGVSLIGSGALGDFIRGTSDLDVAVVARTSLAPNTKARLAGMVSHGVLPCPARRLELVVYAAERLASPEPWRDALSRSLDWHLAHQPEGAATVLNACRAWRWLVEGVWGSKRAAGEWARSQPGAPAVVERAMALGHGGAADRLDRGEVEQLEALVRAVLDQGSDRGGDGL
jgi:hypothetical protein